MRGLLFVILLMGVVVVGCRVGRDDFVSQRLLESDVVDQLYVLSDGLLCGAEPKGEAGYAFLAGLGVKVILSVDSVEPNEGLAVKYGMRTLHVPVGYDGLSVEEQSILIYYFKEAGGKMFVHCHHGTQRGPTAGAVMMMGVGKFGKDEAKGWLKLAGTDARRYGGLYETVLGFDLGLIDDEPRLDVEGAGMAALVMGKVGRGFKVVSKGVKSGVVLSEKTRGEALLLLEGFKELKRVESQSGVRNKDYMKRMGEMVRGFEGLYEGLELMQIGEVMGGDFGVKMKGIKRGCVSCHRVYRD